MIVKRTFTLFFVLLLTTFVVAQSPYDEIHANHEKAGGVYYMYPFDKLSFTAVPKGYEPFYISHYGRHGARYVLTDEQYDDPVKVFSRAAKDGKLTVYGQQVWQRLKKIYSKLKGRAGDLTDKGAWQHRQLAKRMFYSYPEIFHNHPYVEAYSSTVNRCGMSMAAFCEELVRLDPKINVRMEVSRVNMCYLNGYSPEGSMATKKDLEFKTSKASWYPAFKKFCAKKINNKFFVARLFTDMNYLRKQIDPILLELDLFYLACDMPATNYDDVSFNDLFTENDLCALWECDNYTYYVMKGRDFRNKGRSRYLSSGLLREIISSSEADLSGKCGVHLRFGHDGCIMGLLNLMNIDGWNKVVTDPEQIKNVWQSYKIPFASNLQWIFYRNKEKPDDVLIKMLLNEDEIHLPFASDCVPYYHWNDFKRYYGDILKTLKTKN